MKVVFALTNLKTSGGTRVIMELANGLQKRCHDVTLLVPRNADRGTFPLKARVLKRGLIAKGIPYLDLLTYTVTTVMAVPKADAVIATYFYTALPIALRAERPAFYLVQHYETLFCQDPLSRLRDLALRPYGRVCECTYRMDFRFLANSRWVARILKERFGADADLILPAVDRNVFFPSDGNRNHAGPPRILFVGRRARWKGFCDLDKALQQLASQKFDFELVIASQEEIPVSGHFSVRRERPRSDEELADLYRSADLLVHPAWYEGFGLPVLEAMACGTPVVVTRCGGVEDFAVHGLNCWMVEPRSPDALADAMVHMLKHPELRAPLMKAGQETAQKFTWERAVGQLEEALLKRSDWLSRGRLD